MCDQPAVWFVDDLQSNLDKFAADHRDHFDVKPFLDPAQVLARLNLETPDALLCDVFLVP